MNTALRAELAANYSGMIFDEGPHTYTVRNKGLTPVSNVISKFYDKFDSALWSERVARKEGITQEAVLAKWKKINDDSIIRGNRVHNYAEHYAEYIYYGCEEPIAIPGDVQMEAVRRFYAELDAIYQPVGLELRMFDEQLEIAGTADILLHNRVTDKFVIADWKTNADIWKNYKDQTMRPPFEYTLDMPYNHYQIQLSLYQILLEQKNWEIEERWVIWLPHGGGYERHKTFDFTKILRRHFDANRRSN